MYLFTIKFDLNQMMPMMMKMKYNLSKSVQQMENVNASGFPESRQLSINMYE